MSLDPTASAAPLALTPGAVRRNFVLGVANGVLFRLFFAFADSALVMPWFVGQLTRSPLAVGLLLPIDRGGYCLPQLIASRLAQRQGLKMPLYRSVSLVRIGVWALIVLATWTLGGSHPGALLGAFLVLYAVFWLASGLAGVPYVDIVSKAIPADRRGLFFSAADFIGGLVTLPASAAVAYLLSQRSGLAFPANFGWLFLLAGVAALLGMWLFTRIKEPEEAPAQGQVCGVSWQCVKDVLRKDVNFRLFVVARVLLIVNNASLPFYVVFARDRLAAPASLAGTYTVAFTLAIIASTLVWGRLSDRRGNRLVLLAVSAIGVLIPLMPLLGAGRWTPSWFAAVFVLAGVARSGTDLVTSSFVLDLAPPWERVLYIGLLNTVLGVASLSMALWAALAMRLGPALLFVTSSACALAAVGVSLALCEPGHSHAAACEYPALTHLTFWRRR